jgi:hypothetical protein
MQLSAILLSLVPLLPLVQAWSCDSVTVDGVKYDLSILQGAQLASKKSDTPPTTSEARARFDLCGGIPREGADEDQVGIAEELELGLGLDLRLEISTPIPNTPCPMASLFELDELGLLANFLQCPDGTHACLVLVNHKASASPPERITAVIPVWRAEEPGVTKVDGGIALSVKAGDFAGCVSKLMDSSY